MCWSWDRNPSKAAGALWPMLSSLSPHGTFPVELFLIPAPGLREEFAGMISEGIGLLDKGWKVAMPLQCVGKPSRECTDWLWPQAVLRGSDKRV